MYPPTVTLQQWMMQIEKRLMHEERRPLASNAAAVVGAYAAPQTWAPTLTGATGNPTLGSGNLRQGSYLLFGGFCAFNIWFDVGGSGYVAGSGQLSLTLPVRPDGTTVPATQHASCTGHSRVGGSGNPLPFMAEITAGSPTLAMKVWSTTAGNATANYVGSTATASTTFVVSGSYVYV